MKIWKVKVFGIQWDDSHGEHDASHLPTEAEVIVSTDQYEDEYTAEDAISDALDDISDEYGMLIADSERIEATEIADRRKRG